ncbi:MAG: hypothetical protein PF638_06440 [Candidatus Delongbacteria bacterium]|jgi:hypothetical protein|nr:hypothetical protein [Candidatus Delongbacteria bacterium]
MKNLITIISISVLAGFILLSCSDDNSSAPSESITFVKTFGKADSTDAGYSVQQTLDGGYIIAGGTETSTGFWSTWLIKTDFTGNEMWNKTFGLDGYTLDRGFSVKQTTDGGFVITGETKGASLQNGWLIKTDSNGNQEWETIIIEGAQGRSVVETSDKGYVVTGSYRGDLWLVKIDSNGNVIWNKTYGGTDTDSGSEVQQTVDGGYIIIGSSYSYGVGSNDILLLKTDPEGNEEWYRIFGDNGYDYSFDSGFSVQQTTDNGFILTGQYKSVDTHNTNLCLIKTDFHGNEEWSRFFGGTDFAFGKSVKQTRDGGYIVTGHISSGAPTGDAWLLKTDQYGYEEWNISYGDQGYDCGYCVQQTDDGGYILTGTYAPDSTNALMSDILLIKTDSEGNFE